MSTKKQLFGDDYKDEDDLKDTTAATQAEVDALVPKPEAPAAPIPSTTDPALLAILEKFGSALELIAKRDEQGPVRQIPITQMDPRTPFNPEGLRKRPELTRKCFQNSMPLAPSKLFNHEIDLLNQLKPGQYHHRKWLVMETNLGEAGIRLDIYIPNKTQAQRIENAQIAGKGGLATFLQMMVDEGQRVILSA